MNKVKIISISILSISFFSIINAQDNNRQGNSLYRDMSKKNIITYDVRNDAQKVEKELLKIQILRDEVKDQAITIIIDSTQLVSLLIDTTKVNLAEIEKRLNDRGYILLKQEPIVELVVEAKPLTVVEKYNSEIDQFLNREDVSIFSTDFKDLSNYSIHPRSQNYYQLIKNIHTLNNKLSNPDPTKLRIELDEMGKLIDNINDTEKSPKNLLPRPLLDYYKLLVKKYGEIYNQIYPNE